MAALAATAMPSSALNTILQNMNTQNLLAAAAAKTNLVDRHHVSGTSGFGEFSSSSHKGGKSSIALTALTFLAFIFFLNILQNCLEENMKVMQPEVMVMQPARITKIRQNIDRKGETQEETDLLEAQTEPIINKVSNNNNDNNINDNKKKVTNSNKNVRPNYYVDRDPTYYYRDNDMEDKMIPAEYETPIEIPYRDQMPESFFVHNQEDSNFFNRRYDRIAKTLRPNSPSNSSVNYGKIEKVDMK